MSDFKFVEAFDGIVGFGRTDGKVGVGRLGDQRVFGPFLTADEARKAIDAFVPPKDYAVNYKHVQSYYRGPWD